MTSQRHAFTAIVINVIRHAKFLNDPCYARVKVEHVLYIVFYKVFIYEFIVLTKLT